MWAHAAGVRKHRKDVTEQVSYRDAPASTKRRLNLDLEADDPDVVVNDVLCHAVIKEHQVPDMV